MTSEAKGGGGLSLQIPNTLKLYVFSFLFSIQPNGKLTMPETEAFPALAPVCACS